MTHINPFRYVFVSTILSECSRAQNTVNKDRINKLPDEVLLHILSLFSTDDTIITSILSKRWKFLWKQIDHLKFDDQTNYNNRFGEYVLQAVFRYDNKDLQSLTTFPSHQCEPFDLASWIQKAFLRNVRKLVLRLNSVLVPLTIPPEVLQRTNTLKIFKLMGNVNLNLSNYAVYFNCLVELHLYHVKFKDEFSVSHLLDGCTNLEELVVELYISSGVQTFTVDMPKLQRLKVGICNYKEENLVVTTL